MPFSAACSSNRFFSSALRFPAFSAACIWSKTALSSIAARSVDTLQEGCQFHSEALDKQSDGRLTEYMVLALDIV